MKTIRTAMFAASALMIAGFMPALAQNARKPAANPNAPVVAQTTQGEAVTPAAPNPAPQPQTLFTIGNVGVGVWAPVEPVYDSSANRNQAANPLWEAVTAPDRPGF